jgi:transcriptional regulator with PAS, ATPase and Fis domain
VRISTALLKDDSGNIIGGVETFQDLSQIEQLQKELQARYSFEDIIGKSSEMRKLFELLPQIADSSSTVLIEGASGTGKELFAKAIHNLSPRKNHKFVAINCAALPDTLLESELFGYKAGAFTDARKDKPGRFLTANKGTIFLDEIGDISPATQVKLLRVLQERKIEPLGSIEPVSVDVRVVAATKKDLNHLVQDGTFRDDLFYRIRVVQINLPELCRRREDIPLLIDHLITKFNTIFSKDILRVTNEVMTTLMGYPFPGNVRELENILEHAFILCKGSVIEVHHLPPELHPAIPHDSGNRESTSLKTMEKHIISDTLRRFEGSRKKTAQALGINPSTLYRKIKSLNIDTPEADGRS